jgi:hypothetical protein
MKFKFLYIFFLALTFQMFGQNDNEKKSIKIPAEETKEKDTIPSSLKITAKEDFEITKTEKNIKGIPFKSKVEIKEHQEGFSMIDNNTLMDPGQIFEKKWSAKAVEQGFKQESMEDQFLGDYRSNGEFVNIMCRDHEFPDGDLVRVFVNDDIYIPRLLLTGGYKSFNVPLQLGFNKIVFLALNQGESGPNTAEFQVYDDNGVLVSSKKWNLLTGVKATIIVTKE